MTAGAQVAIEPPYERGHHCKVCERTTMHDYFAQQSTDVPSQRDPVGEERFCTSGGAGTCGILVCLDSPEEFAERCLRRETRRMRQRRSKRKCA